MARRFAIGFLGAVLVLIQAAFTPGAADDDKYSKQQLDQMLAPIALYPDDLLTNVLMASTYPLDVVAADRWRRDPQNAKLKGDALTKALENKDWDPSIKALVQFPDVLKMMSDKLDWTQTLGEAFLAQQSDVMDEIQVLRGKADEAGNLKSTKQQKVVKESGSNAQPIYIIEPANPETVYVPVYEPTVYGSWWYPDYPPYYWGYPGARYVDGWFWGAGVAIAGGIWGWNHCDWHHRDIDIDVNKWNNINVNKNRVVSNKWQHDPNRRGPVPYKNKDVRDKFQQADRGKIGKDDFRGRDRQEIQDRLKDTDHSRIDKGAGQGARDKAGDRGGGGGPGDKIKDRGGDRAGGNVKDRAGDRPQQKGAAKTVNRKVDRPQARKPSPGALDVKRGADVRRDAARGHASRVSMASRPNISRGGGGPRGGGGFRGGGGGRRR